MKKVFIGLLVVIGVALWSVWPMVVRLDRVADYGKDGMLIAAIQMNWHQKITDYIRHKTDSKMGLFDGYFFYAEKNSLAFSDMLFTTSLLTYWPAKLSNNPVMAAGLALVMGQVLMMIISYVVFARMSKSVWGGVLGAVAFGLSQIHFMYQVHLQVWSMQYWLLSYWLFRQKKYFWSAVFLGMQTWESPLGVYFGLVAIFVHLVTYHLIFKLIFRNLVILGLTFGVVAFLPSKAYWDVSNVYRYVRTIRDAAYHGLSVNNLDGFWSMGLFALFVLAIYKLVSYKVSEVKLKSLKFFGWLIIFSYLLALGPVLKWDNKTVKIGGAVPIPLPYAAAYYLVPGWQAFRVPSRWMVLVGWGAAGIVACGVGSYKVRKLGILGCIAVAMLGGTRLTKYVDLPRVIPKEYLVNEEVLTFKPMGGELEEIERMYFSILAGKKTMNGFSGFLPPGRVKWLMNEKYVLEKLGGGRVGGGNSPPDRLWHLCFGGI